MVFSFIFRRQMDLAVLVFGVKQVLVPLLDYLVVVGFEVLELVGSPLEGIGRYQKFALRETVFLVPLSNPTPWDLKNRR
tara:strand:- start:325 stop:561 length:237 start_codon:yes stop_codon:yes gene_type:complete